jgi:prolyl-tRNA synthetase
LRFTDLGVTTLREAAHPLLDRAGYTVKREFTPLGERLLAKLFPGGVERRTAPPGTRARHGLLVGREYLVAPGADVPGPLPTVADGTRLLAESAHGDEAFGRCASCRYEGVEIGWPAPPSPPEDEHLAEHHTPDCPGIDAVVAHFPGLTAERMLKCFAAGNTVILVPGDRDVRIPPGLEAGVPEGLPVGYIGPMGLQDRGIRVLADHAVRARPGPWCTGANRDEHHVTGATLGRDFTVDEWGSFATLAAGDPCPQCGAPMTVVPAFEVRSAQGVVGASRVVQLLADRYHDDAGLVWPPAVAPFARHLITIGGVDPPDGPDGGDDAHTLWDDRAASPGVKFADADLIGLPTQLILGPKSAARGVIEQKDRGTGARTEVPLR